MSDIFEETEDTQRREAWLKMAKTAAPWAAGAAALALAAALSVWGWQSMQAAKSAKASETFQAGIEAAAKGDSAAAKASFEQTAKDGNAAYKTMSLMELAGLAVRDGKPDDAITHFDAAAKASGDPRLADLAALKAAYLVMDKSAPLAEVEKRLKPLAEEKRPYAYLAREALAMSRLQSGDVTGARTELNALSFALGAPEGVKQRAQLYVQAIDSGAADTIKAVMALPAVQAPTLPAGMPEGLQIEPQ